MSNIWLAGKGLTQSECTIDFPRPDRLVKGNPERHTYSAYAHPNMDCGIWQCEIGAWNIVFADNKQEFFTVIEGHVCLHHKHSNVIVDIQAGEAGIIPPGFEGTFEVVQKVKKYYAVVEA
ncbi:cupin domain-containing protein [Acinetobacter tianfuensis]|uniref:DUF861 domain-containing protein n=1 Tax=Acinetobacter tianfuensis TaxID=2419603 RepID=A0A3A8F1U4_9GAMM|nr:cupin domain-containing protein [Acinetobacter tianfuensis]RKG34663.1 DUF861 domain-containing protein [Acinetobacter tianfuensis]